MTGRILNKLRLDSKKSVSEIASLLAVTPGTISHYEHGRRLPDPEKIMEFSDLFHVSADYLLGRTEYAFDLAGLGKDNMDLTVCDIINHVYFMKTDKKIFCRQMELMSAAYSEPKYSDEVQSDHR